MLTAHIPSGYCLAKLSGWRGKALAAALIGAVLPDTDLLWFIFVDHGAVHHHRYWFHIPLFWAVVALLVLPLLWRTRYRVAGIAFFAAIFLHMLLDTINGGIMWAAPVSDRLWRLVSIPASHKHWILSFMLHWTFLFELLIWALAGYLFLSDRKRPVSKRDYP